MLHTLRGQGFDRLLTLDGTPPAPPSVYQCLYHTCMLHTGAGVIRYGQSRKISEPPNDFPEQSLGFLLILDQSYFLINFIL